MKQPVEFAAAANASRESHDRYRLSPREAYVLRSAPIRGVGQVVVGRRHEAPQRYSRTIWIVGDENLTNVVERLLQRGFLAHRPSVGPTYVELTAEGGDQRGADRGAPMTRTSVPQTHPPGTGWNDWREVSRHHSPYRHHLVEAWRREWQTVEVLRIADLPAEFNVAGLYWRPLQPPTAEPEVTRPRPANSAPPLDERLGKP